MLAACWRHAGGMLPHPDTRCDFVVSSNKNRELNFSDSCVNEKGGVPGAPGHAGIKLSEIIGENA